MNLLVTGSDLPLGRAAAESLESDHTLRLCGRSSLEDKPAPDQNYHKADLTTPGTATDLVEGVDAVLHLENHDPDPPETDDEECELLRRASLGSYRLCTAAREADVDRVIVAGTLDVYEGYPKEYVVDERWKPRPGPEAERVAPYLAELSAREFPREGGLHGICLRMGPLGDDPEETSRANALHAITCALDTTFEPAGYRWHVFNIGNSTRFLSREANTHMGYQRQERN
jgi:nucleoside-diphosphate-sugar epimerase